MTDNEIIKAFECCENNCDCLGCPKLDSTEGCNGVAEEILDLINRQKEEITKNENIIEATGNLIDALKKEIEALISGQETLQKYIAEKDAEIEQYKARILNDTEYIEKIEVENRKQKAEIERLQKYNTDVAFKHYNDGVKEFAERLKKKQFCFGTLRGGKLVSRYAVDVSDIDKAYEEMVGE